MLEAKGPNAEQIHYWNEVSGPKWVKLDHMINGLIEPIGSHAIAEANPQPGERVLDVGCGCGDTSLKLAAAVGSEGSVVGVDVSAPMLAEAISRRDRTGASNLDFENADAQIGGFTQGFHDLVFSRFGVMFFADPIAAFANLRSSLRPGGRIVFACWQSREKNPWLSLPAAAAMKHFETPPAPPIEAPGPFSLCDSERITRLLEGAGFVAVRCRSVEQSIDVSAGLSLDEAVKFLAQMGPTGTLLNTASEDVRNAALGSIREVLVPHRSDQGIELGSAFWIVSAMRN